MLVTGLKGRIVVIVAGPGYGKTTQLVQAVSRATSPTVWLSCDDRVTDELVLVDHLMAALEPMLPQVARPAFANASPVLGLCNGLARWGEDVILAFDRVEALRGSAESALTSLARDLPPNVHLALASRVEPGLPRSLLVGSDVLRVDHEMLALNKDEGRELALLLDPDCDESLLTTILTDAEGWPAGLSLAARSVRKGRPPTIDGEPLTAYLAVTVDDDQPPEVQRFLVATSVLDSFTPELAEAVSGEENAGAIIAGLLTNHHFTVPVPEEDGRYRYLHLVAAFLRRRLERTDPTHLAELHHRAGAAFAARGAPADAVPHYLAAGSVEEAADALDQIAHEIAGGPRAEALVGWLDTIPRELWWARPGLVLAHASLLFGEGRYEEAWDALEQALQTLLERGEQERAAVAFLRLLQVALADGTPERGLEAADHWLARLDPESGLVPAVRVARAACAAWARGPRGLDRQFEVDPEAGQGPIPAVPLFAIASRAYFIDHLAGRSASALSTIETVIAALETYEHADDPLAYLFTVHTYRAFLLAHLGRWEEALGALEPWERMAERRAMGNVARRLAPWVRLPALAGLGRWQELEAEFVVLPIPRPATAYWTRYHAIAAQLAAHAGDAARVEAHASHVATPQSFFEAMACCDMAVSAWTVGLGNVAAALAERAREGSEACGADLARARAALIQAAVRGPSSGDELLEEALDLSAQLGLEELWARRERAFAGPLLAHALCARVGEPRVAARLAVACGGDVLTAVADAIERAPTAARAEFATALGDASVCEGAILRRLASDRHTIVRAAAESTRARLAARPRAPLAIVSFGTFAVSRAGRPLNDPALRRAKPRALLTALLCARGPAHRDQLLEWLWPDLDPDRARASLHTTLSALRRALEDGRAGPGGGVIVTDGESYRMALREDDDWDAERFLRLARNAERAGALEARISRLLAAETARSAPFLPEWPYEEWARATRGAIDRAHETVLESLGDAFVEVGQPEAAVSRYARLLELDPERERWHRALMRAYAAAQERGLAVRQFHLCRQLLRERLGVEPGEETQALFRTLL